MIKTIKIISVLILSCCSFPIMAHQDPVHIKGTKCYIVCPKGFTASSNFNGLYNPKTKSSIIINEFPNSYETLGPFFTREALAEMNIELIESKQLKHMEHDALLLKVTEEVSGKKFMKNILIFGNYSYTVIVNGVYPEEESKMEKPITKSVLSTTYNRDLNLNPFSAVDYTISIPEPYQLTINFSPESLFFTPYGDLYKDKTAIYTGKYLMDDTITDFKKFAEYNVDVYRNKKVNIKSTEEIEIDSMKGYEVIAVVGKSELIYQVILFNNNGYYYAIYGKAEDKFNKNKRLFRDMARTFKRKTK